MPTHRNRYWELVRQSPASHEAANFAARFAIVENPPGDSDELQTYDLSDNYFRLMFAAGFWPTNNHHEQQLRHCESTAASRKARAGTSAGVTTNGCGPPLTPAKSKTTIASRFFPPITSQLENQPARSLLNN